MGTLSLLPQLGTATVPPSAHRYVRGWGAPLTEDPHPTLPPGDPWLHPLLGLLLEELLWRAVCPPASTVSAMLRATNLGIPSASQGTRQSYTPDFCIQQNAPIMVVKI